MQDSEGRRYVSALNVLWFGLRLFSSLFVLIVVMLGFEAPNKRLVIVYVSFIM